MTTVQGAGGPAAALLDVNEGSVANGNAINLALTGAQTIDGTSALTLAALTVNRINASGVTSATTGLALTGDGAANTIIGGAGVDTIVGGGAADLLTGGGGVDVFMNGTSGQGVSTTSTTAANSFSNAYSISIAPTDIINDFTATDTINAASAGNAVNASNLSSNLILGASNFYLRGSYNQGASTFSTLATGADLLVSSNTDQAGATFLNNTSLVVLQGFNAELANANFV